MDLLAQASPVLPSLPPVPDAGSYVWAILGLATAIVGLAGYHVKQLVDWRADRERLIEDRANALREASEKHHREKVEHVEKWAADREKLELQHRSERDAWQAREAELVAAKDRVYNEMTLMLRDLLSAAQGGAPGGGR